MVKEDMIVHLMLADGVLHVLRPVSDIMVIDNIAMIRFRMMMPGLKRLNSEIVISRSCLNNKQRSHCDEKSLRELHADRSAMSRQMREGVGGRELQRSATVSIYQGSEVNRKILKGSGAQ